MAAPDSTKVLKGSFRQDRKKQATFAAKPLTRMPVAPKTLSDEARAFWKQCASELVPLKMLSKSDLPMFRIMCEGYAVYHHCLAVAAAADYVAIGAAGQTVTHPLLTTAKQWYAEVCKLAERFGLTPGAKARIAPPQSDPHEKSPWDKM